MSVYLLSGAEHRQAAEIADSLFDRHMANRWSLKGGSEHQFFQIFSSVPAFFPDSQQYRSQVEFWGMAFDAMSKYSLEERASDIKELGYDGGIRVAGANNGLCFFSEKSEAPVIIIHREGREGRTPLVHFAQELSKLGKIAAYSTVNVNGTGTKKPVRRHDIEYLLLGEGAEGGEVVFPFQLPDAIYDERGGAVRPALPVKTWVSETDEDGKPCGWSDDSVAAANGVGMPGLGETDEDGHPI